MNIKSDRFSWRMWYAWYPVKTESGFKWMEWVWRRLDRDRIGLHADGLDYEYSDNISEEV